MATSLVLRRACLAVQALRRGLVAAPALRDLARASSSAPDGSPSDACAPPKPTARSPPTYTRTTSYAADIEDVLAVSSERMQSWIRGHKADGGARSSHVAWGKILDQSHVVKAPSDSLLTVELPFGRDAAFRSRYLNFRNHLRVGRLLEELDAFAGHLAYRHCEPPEGSDSDPPILVTVSTDRVDLLQYPLPADRDMVMTGMVTYVGASSLNIDIDMSLVGEASDAAAASGGSGAAAATGGGAGATRVPVLQASFTFVARDTNNKAVKVRAMGCRRAAQPDRHQSGMVRHHRPTAYAMPRHAAGASPGAAHALRGGAVQARQGGAGAAQGRAHAEPVHAAAAAPRARERARPVPGDPAQEPHQPQDG